MSNTKLKQDYLVVKLNALNEMRAKEMTLQELRLFSIYLSKINPKDPSTRCVRFSVADLQAIMELKKIDIMYLKHVATSILSKPVFVPTERGGFDAYNLFSRFKVDADEQGEWYVDINANEEAMPLLFDFQSHFFKYELWNTLRLKGKNQYRMYEVLKQYERTGYRIISIINLKGMLGIEEHEYPQYKIFKRDVLEPCRKALSERTDITYTYEPHSKKGRKIQELKFTITKNKKHKDPLSLSEFIDVEGIVSSDEVIDIWDMDEDDIDLDALSKYDARLLFFRSAVSGEFTKEQLVVLCDIISTRMPQIFNDDKECYDHLRRKYNEMKLRDSHGEIRHSRFSYLKAIVGTE